MTTLYGSWQGTGYKARIYCVYTVSYTADHTQAIYAISFGVEFGESVSDSANTWAVSGDCGAASGSNISYSIPSGGGSKIFRSGETAQKYGDATVAASIDNVEAVGGGVISASFTLESGALAPYFVDNVYNADIITSTTARFNNWAGTGNGGTLNNVQVEYNTTPSATGALTYTKGSYALPTISGLTPNTLYYARIRISNTTYGYSAWGPWVSFRTLSTTPSAPSNAWYAGNIDQQSADILGIVVPNDGGATIDEIRVRVSTDPAFGTYTDYIDGNVTSVHIHDLSPGTLYYAQVFAHNVNGDSPASGTQTFTTLPGVYVRVGGVWKNAVAYVNVNGIWKPATRFVNVSGVWKQ